MKAYAVGILREVELGPAIREYVEKIDGTLNPFGGRFIVHGGPATVLEGDFAADFIFIEFPSRAGALAWYQSRAYQEIAILRKANAKGEIFIIEGVGEGHRATDIL